MSKPWLFLLSGVLIGSALSFYFINLILSVNSQILIESKNIVASPIDIHKSEAAVAPEFLSNTETTDAREEIIENFLIKHNSPMAGHGKTFIFMADKYGIDWKLLPAIAFQESNLGKKIPSGSHNAWGWAIYTGKNSGASFDNWSHAIETVARGIKERYINRGLTTPETIMTRYTPNSDGSWAFGVRFAMDEMTQ